nr:hypothetical protein FVER53263_00134 [Fusarium verticillioides]
MVCGSLFGDTKKNRSSFPWSSDQHRATQNKISHFARPADEMDWEQSQTSQAIRHLDYNLTTKLQLLADKQSIEIQKYLQARPSNLEDTLRKIFDDYVADGRIIIQSPDSHEAPTQSLSAGSPKQQVTEVTERNAEIQQLISKLQRAEEELNAVKSELEKAEIRTDQLRKLIIPAGTEQILDSKLQQLFSEIRTLTQKVVSKIYTKPPRYWESSVEHSRAFFKEIKDYTPGLQQDAIQSELFACLRQLFLSNQIKDYRLGERYETLQTLLRQTEEALAEAVGARFPGERHMKEMQEWRRATFKCTELLQDTSNNAAYDAANLAEYFKPAETEDPKAQQRGRKYLQTLCERSFELGALMRRTEDTFEVFSVKDDTPLLDCEDIAEKWRSYGEKDGSGVEITVFCLFGGLRKISKEYPTKPVVLEKAHVATQFVMPAE